MNSFLKILLLFCLPFLNFCSLKQKIIYDEYTIKHKKIILKNNNKYKRVIYNSNYFISKYFGKKYKDRGVYRRDSISNCEVIIFNTNKKKVECPKINDTLFIHDSDYTKLFYYPEKRTDDLIFEQRK